MKSRRYCRHYGPDLTEAAVMAIWDELSPEVEPEPDEQALCEEVARIMERFRRSNG